jgi:hypothetical protein
MISFIFSGAEKTNQKGFVHFSHAREKEPKSALPPRPPSKGDAKRKSQKPTISFKF